MNQKGKEAWKYLLFAAALMVVLAAPEWVQAGSGGPLEGVYGDLRTWVTGNVGKVAALAMILVGFIGGIVKQSLGSFVVGVGGGMGLSASPDVIELVFTATLVS